MTDYIGDRVGQQLGNYQLVSFLGQGSFAEVYLAEHKYLKNQAAIKVLHTRLSINDQENFLSEARVIAGLKHEHIVQVLEFGVEEGIPFLVMDYAPNGTFRQRYPQDTRLTSVNILPAVRQITEALQYAHDQKIIHRDIKPENMLLGVNNEILLSDFGLAIGAQSSRSQSMKDVAGTVAYMAPELLQGRPCPASDQYALGIIMYEWLSGDYPFHGSFTEIASQHVLVSPPRLYERVPGVSLMVEEVVLIALAKDPGQRFRSMLAFANAFEQAYLQGDATTRTYETSPWYSLPIPLIELQDERATQPIPNNHSQLRLSTSGSTHIYQTQRKLEQRSSRLRSRASLLIALVLLITASGLGLIYYGKAFHSAELHTRATSTAQNLFAVSTALQERYVKATSGNPMLNDPLSKNDSNNWSEGEAKGVGSCIFIEGSYHASALEPYYYTYYCVARTTSFSNFAFQVEMTIIKGDEGGLVFRLSSQGTYIFTVDQNGSYSLIVVLHGNEIRVVLHRPSSAIQVGLDRPNLLTVIAQGNRIYLYVNRRYVADIRDDSSTSGQIGVSAFDTLKPTEVAFSNAQVWG